MSLAAVMAFVPRSVCMSPAPEIGAISALFLRLEMQSKHRCTCQDSWIGLTGTLEDEDPQSVPDARERVGPA